MATAKANRNATATFSLQTELKDGKIQRARWNRTYKAEKETDGKYDQVVHASTGRARSHCRYVGPLAR